MRSGIYSRGSPIPCPETQCGEGQKTHEGPADHTGRIRADASGLRIPVTELPNDLALVVRPTNWRGDQKNRETVFYPVVDDFADFLLKTPPEQREGFVFNPQRGSGKISRRVDTVSGWIVDIGEKACVKVDMRKSRKKNRKPEDSEEVPVWGSAHDMRRAFGYRWAQIAPPMILRDLMRHASVQTTEKYYVGINAKKTLEHLRNRKRASLLTLGLTPADSDDPEQRVHQ